MAQRAIGFLLRIEVAESERWDFFHLGIFRDNNLFECLDPMQTERVGGGDFAGRGIGFEFAPFPWRQTLPMITDHLISRRFETALRKPKRRLSDHIVVVGLGNVGYHAAMQLHELGESVVVVERNRESFPQQRAQNRRDQRPRKGKKVDARGADGTLPRTSMASLTLLRPLRHLTERDREILAALERCATRICRVVISRP